MKKVIASMMAVLATATMSAFAALPENCWKPEVASGDWNNPDNWSLGHVPTTSEMASFQTDCPSCTVNIDSDCSVGDFYAYAYDGSVLTFTGDKTLTVTGGAPYFRRHVVVDGPSVVFLNSNLMTYRSVTVKSGSLSCDAFWRYGGEESLTVDGGTVTCNVRFYYYTWSAAPEFLFVKSGAFSTPLLVGLENSVNGSHGKNSFAIEVSGGVAQIGNLDLRLGPKTELKQTGGELRLSDGMFSDKTTVSLTGGTVKFVGDLEWPKARTFYETICGYLGSRPGLSDVCLCGAADGVLSDSASLTVRGVKSTRKDPLRVDLDGITFTGGAPFAYDTKLSPSHDIHLYGPTVLRTTTDLAYAETAEDSVYVILHGDVTVDTGDPSEASVGRKMYLRGLTSTDGSGSLTVRGCGELVVRPYGSYDALKSVTVEAGATLGLVDRSTSSYAWGHFATESFALGPNATLKLTAGGNFVEAADWAIDPTAKIVVTVPAEFTTGAFPILRDADSKDLPSDWVDRVELVGGPVGLAVKSEAGQLTGYLRDDELGKWGDFEWMGAGANAKWSTPANWKGNVWPGEKNVMYFGSSSVTNSQFDKFNPSGSTMARLIFETNAVSSFRVWGAQMTASSPSPAVESWSKVPQRVDDQLRMTGTAMSLLAQEDAPVVFGDNTGFAFEKKPLVAVLTIGGDIRMKGTGMRFPRIEFTSTAAPLSFTKLTVLPGATFSATNQESDIYGIDAGFRVGGGGTLNIAGANGYFRRDRTSGLQVVNGTMNVSVPICGTGAATGTHGRSQKFGGRGWLNLSAGTRSGVQGTRFLFTDELNVALASWSTATADGNGAMAIRVEGTPTLHVTDGWTYGPAAGVTPASEVADRALVVQGGATLTVEAGGGTVRFADPFIGDVMTAHLPSTLAISNGTLALDGSFETDVSVKPMSGGTLSVTANQTVGGLSAQGGTLAVSPGAVLSVEGDVDVSALEFADVGNAWRTYVTATGTITGLAARKSIKFRTVELDGGATALQVKNITGLSITIR